MSDTVSLTIDGKPVKANKGTLLVDAAKMAGIDIPVFCYHPKMEPVGMCRMCLVEIGMPMVDRATGELQRDENGEVKLWFNPKLETACTTYVKEGMVVLTDCEKAVEARIAMLEFTLSSHPLDCPVCDKGGECPLQNLTMEYGPSESRIDFDDKKHMDKHVQLSELIYLDRERCIQCARCIRFQSEIVDDPVLAFFNRGRSTDIVSYSDPPFDSIFSGNTTDICPVGALTTADFRFGARAWELTTMPSICNLCAVGCNIAYDVRREAKSGGKIRIKRVMPRQNESVNELWICDKGRFGYHYLEEQPRLEKPLLRKDGELVEVDWPEAYQAAEQKLIEAGSDSLMLVGGGLSNEDYFNLYDLCEKQGGQPVLNSYMAGGDLSARFGLSSGSNLAELAKGDVVLVVASDLHQEAPLWWLRIKQAAERGASLVVLNHRKTRLDKFAAHSWQYELGHEASIMKLLGEGDLKDLPKELKEIAKTLSDAQNLVIFYGSEGLGLERSAVVANECARLIVKGGHAGKKNSGVVPVWHAANIQGAWDMGFKPETKLAEKLLKTELVYIAGTDPAGEDPELKKALETCFVIVQSHTSTKTTELADLVLPVQTYIEREGTFTNGERRVQRFYPVVPPLPGPKPDYRIVAELSNQLGRHLHSHAASVFAQISMRVPSYKGIQYPELSEYKEQWPLVGGSDLYFGGTGYLNQNGLGIKLPADYETDHNSDLPAVEIPQALKIKVGELKAVPITRLYSGSDLAYAELLEQRMEGANLYVHSQTVAEYKLEQNALVTLQINETSLTLKIVVDDTWTPGAVYIPRKIGIPFIGAAAARIVEIKTPEEAS